MMFAARRRDALVSALRSELLAIRDAVRGALDDVETRRRADDALRDELIVSLVRCVTDLAGTLNQRSSEMLTVLERLGELGESIASRQREQTDSILVLLERFGAALELDVRSHRAPERRVVGGTVEPSRTESRRTTARDSEVHGDDDRLLLEGVEVRCRFAEGGWVSGFEVSDVISDAGTLRYRLRRRCDGYVLPTLFDEASIRARV
ncbi:MAG TPA: hypothetical protein VFC33_20380 [Acidimicrobiia bacterium]|nr:hypothetical protein [Acidimicrobiia bacterium]